MPPIYADDPTSPLYDVKRNVGHLPPTVIDLNYDYVEPTFPDSEIVENNLSTMYRQVVQATLFLGNSYRAGDQPDLGPGALESVPHNTVHSWIGLFDEPNEDMGNFYTAGSDPIFFIHHSNPDVDDMEKNWR